MQDDSQSSSTLDPSDTIPGPQPQIPASEYMPLAPTASWESASALSQPGQEIKSVPLSPSPLSASTPYPFQPNDQTTLPPVLSARRKPSQMVRVILIALAIIVIGSLGGIFFTTYHTQSVSQANATATTSAHESTATGIVRNTALAENASATAAALVTASTTAANPDPYSSGGHLLLYDPLQSNDYGGSWNWDGGPQCAFQDSSYQVIDTSSQYIAVCNLVPSSNFADFAMDIKMTLLQGDLGGFYFRDTSNGTTGYQFTIDTRGYYQLSVYSDPSAQPKVLTSGAVANFTEGHNHTNTIGVLARGDTLTLFVNFHKAGSIKDHTFNQGLIALLASNYKGDSGTARVAFKELRIWSL